MAHRHDRLELEADGYGRQIDRRIKSMDPLELDELLGGGTDEDLVEDELLEEYDVPDPED